MTACGPKLPSWATRQFDSYLGNTGRAANVVATAAFPPDSYRARRMLVTEGVGQIRPSRGAAEDGRSASDSGKTYAR
jgi:hypothetical protein